MLLVATLYLYKMSKRDILKNIYLDTLEYSSTLHNKSELPDSIKLKLNPNQIPNLHP